MATMWKHSTHTIPTPAELLRPGEAPAVVEAFWLSIDDDWSIQYSVPYSENDDQWHDEMKVTIQWRYYAVRNPTDILLNAYYYSIQCVCIPVILEHSIEWLAK